MRISMTESKNSDVENLQECVNVLYAHVIQALDPFHPQDVLKVEYKWEGPGLLLSFGKSLDHGVGLKITGFNLPHEDRIKIRRIVSRVCLEWSGKTVEQILKNSPTHFQNVT